MADAIKKAAEMKSKTEEFQRLFNMPATETVIQGLLTISVITYTKCPRSQFFLIFLALANVFPGNRL
jgi:hypothetical protein